MSTDADAKDAEGHIPPAIQHIEQFLCQFSALRIQPSGNAGPEPTPVPERWRVEIAA
ncbi:MAG: hypothetical protein ACLSAH_17340 [Bilophila wadsworthia]